MARMQHILTTILLAMLLAACSEHPATPPGEGIDAEVADADAAVADVDAKVQVDAAVDGADTAYSVDALDASTANDSADTTQNCAQAGLPGCPCTTGDECDTGKCLDTPDGHACAATCVDAGCPAGFVCKSLGGSDPLNYCVISHLSQCAPCSTNKDCQTQGVTDALCLDYGDGGHFCGGACGSDADCSVGYGCVDVPDPAGGGKVKQCKKTNGQCECSVWAKTAGTTTMCSATNAIGSCSGSRACAPAGLTGCSAKTPAPESCNNQDDDCNGAIDDLPVDATCAVSNDLGTCLGQQVCQGGVGSCIGAKTPKAEDCNGEDDNCDGSTDEGFSFSGLGIGSACGTGACAGGSVVCASFQSATCSTAVNASVETCNGIDDNCDGSSDEGTCSDGNPCTADLCNGGSSACQHLAVEAACDDGDPCTLADACSSTTCIGTPSACDDGNPCTTDTCDPKTGACGFANQPGSCSDGNACTSGDACGAIAGGGWGCLAGGVIDCNDSNLCTDDACDLSSGCTYSSNNATQACYDGADGTAGKGLCHSGLRYCVGGLLDSVCKGEVTPVTPEPCNGLDDSCNGTTDEGCQATTVTLSFAAAQTSGPSGTLSANVLLAPDRPAIMLQDPMVPHQMALGVLAWFLHLLTGN
jgi:hypothetical protein